MSFDEALQPFVGYRYDENGYVDVSGKVRNRALGCSGFATAVLYRLQNGENWLDIYKDDAKAGKWPYRWYGDAIAAHFQLGAAIQISPAQVADQSETRRLVDEKVLKSGGLYFFNVRNGRAGHVGFVRLNSDGKFEQWNYSGLKAYRGLGRGDFRKWKSASQYRDRPVELYLIPE
jgi:hypothetical protein